MLIVKRLFRLAIVLIGLALIVVLAGGALAWRAYMKGLPVISGEISTQGVEKNVEIVRDKYGIPHIFANKEKDLYYAVGYVHAQDRLWQMDLLRRSAKGKISEIVGNRPQPNAFTEGATTLAFDRFSRTIGFGEIAGRIAENLNPKTREMLEAYAAGINDYIAQNRRKLPIEFSLLNYRPEPWDITDSLAIFRFIAWGLSSNAEMELLRVMAKELYGEERMWELFPKHEDPGPFVIPREVRDYRLLRKKVSKDLESPSWAFRMPMDFLDRLTGLQQSVTSGASFYHGIPAASNNWVVDGTRSVSGKPILANDPHLPHLTPSVFYPIHMKQDDIDVIGVSFPGFPFMMLGHTRTLAWAATTTRADTQDIFVEKINPKNPNEYEYKGEWVPFEIRRERILYKSGMFGGWEVDNLTVRTSRHGPIINDALPDLRLNDAAPMALAWAGHEVSDEGFGMMLTTRAKTVDDFYEAVKENAAPISNLVFADTEGNIAYFPAGYIPNRNKGDGSFPVPGWTGMYDWKGWIPYEDIPQLRNPERGFIDTANNQVVPPEDYPYAFSTQYMAGYRAERIEELLLSKPKHNADDMRKYQMDVIVPQGRRIAPIIVKALRSAGGFLAGNPLYAHAAAALENWDYDTRPEQVAPTIFYRTYEETMRATLSDELPASMVKRFVKGWTTDIVFDNGLERGTFSFFDDIETKEKTEGRDDMILRGFERAVAALTEAFGADVSGWEWGKVHTMTFAHTIGSQKPLDKIFNDGPYPKSGARHTVNAGLFEYNHGNYRNLYGPTWRTVIDMADVENASWIIDTGASGQPASPHYLDQSQKWLIGETIPMLMDREDIEKEAEGTLVLKSK